MEIITKNDRNSNERTVCSLKEIEKRKIVEHNDLITSVAKMDKTPLKIFELAVSCIDTENLPKDNIIYLSKKNCLLFLMYRIMESIHVLKKRLKKCRNKLFLKSKKLKVKDTK
ncbi:hypothetical protein LLT7_13680 [Lactococcus cremoris subsp. cremoris TIFN7]|nr:hypothetical protein LLT7_13680 [Lactococcus cremoris subsp. cremoris TIFN7]